MESGNIPLSKPSNIHLNTHINSPLKTLASFFRPSTVGTVGFVLVMDKATAEGLSFSRGSGGSLPHNFF